MGDLIDKVALAVLRASDPNSSKAWESYSIRTRDEWRSVARAAITAMREPTEMMAVSASMDFALFQELWAKAIDEALND